MHRTFENVLLSVEFKPNTVNLAMSMSQTISRLSLFDVLVKIIPGVVFLAVILTVSPSRSSLLNTRSGGAILLALSIPVAYVVGVLLQGTSSNCFPRKKHFQDWMREARENITTEKEDGKLIVSGGNHVKSVVLADATIRFDLDRKYLTPSDSPYDEKSLETNPVFHLVCALPIYVVSQFGLVSDPKKDDRVYYGGEKIIFNILREHASQNGYTEFMRFQRIFVLHRTLTLIASFSFLLLLVAIPSKMANIYDPLLSVPELTVLLVLSFLSAVIFYNGMEAYAKTRDKRLLYSYYADKSGSLNVSPKYALEVKS